MCLTLHFRLLFQCQWMWSAQFQKVVLNTFISVKSDVWFQFTGSPAGGQPSNKHFGCWRAAAASRNQSPFAFTWALTPHPRRRQLPGGQLTWPSPTHRALLSTREPLDAAMVFLLCWWGCHWRCIPCSQALKAQRLSDSRMRKCHESCPASYGACARLGTGTELEPGPSWADGAWEHRGRILSGNAIPHGKATSPHLPSPPLSASLSRDGSSVMGSA